MDHQWNGDRLVGLAHERGRTITIEWNDHHTRITALTANDGRRIDYTYDPAGRLTEARTAGGGARRYTWNEAGLIATVTDPDGVVEAANAYNERGQVTSQRSRFGRTSHYTYLPGNITQVADSDGGRANTWIHDQRGRLVGMVDADGNRQSIGWDRWGNRVQVTGRDGAVTVFRYDGRGRLTDHVLETGARFSYEWDGADRLVAVRRVDEDPAGVLFAYEGEDRNPSTVTDPAGGVTRLVWDRNLLTRVVDPTGRERLLAFDNASDALLSSTSRMVIAAPLDGDDWLRELDSFLGDGATAVLFGHSRHALRAFGHLRDAGRAIGDQGISLVSFDDLDVFSLLTPAIAAITQHPEQLAGRAMAMLSAMIDGERPGSQRIETSLIPRESLAPPATG